MKAIKQTYAIKAPLDRVWQAFVDPKVIKLWGGGPADMSDEDNFEFSLWGGDIHGINTKVTKHKLLQQDWFSGNWKQPSRVVFYFTKKNGHTTVKLEHSGVPDSDERDIAQGWQDYYIGPIKQLLEE